MRPMLRNERTHALRMRGPRVMLALTALTVLMSLPACGGSAGAGKTPAPGSPPAHAAATTDPGSAATKTAAADRTTAVAGSAAAKLLPALLQPADVAPDLTL